MNLATARQMHDNDLVAAPGPVTHRVLQGRKIAATAIRLAVARAYGRGDMGGSSQWHVIPCLTPQSTIGIVDIAKGTAWDTTTPALTEVHDLGFEDAPYAAANVASGGATIRVDGKAVQRDGASIVDGQTIQPTLPEGWRQISLPTWRGYDGQSPYRPVPATLIKPQSWIEPKLVCHGLITCYGRPGTDMGKHLTRTMGWDAKWPWGVPPWIEGQSVALIHTLIMTAAPIHHPHTQIHRPRGTDAEEQVWTRNALAAATEAVATKLDQLSRDLPQERDGSYLRDYTARLREHDCGMIPRHLQGALRRGRTSLDAATMVHVTHQLLRAIEAPTSWDRARALGSNAFLAYAVLDWDYTQTAEATP